MAELEACNSNARCQESLQTGMEKVGTGSKAIIGNLLWGGRTNSELVGAERAEF